MPRSLIVALLACALVLALSLLSSVSAFAVGGECGRSGRPWVAVRLKAPGFGAELIRAVLTDVGTETRRHGIDACLADSQDSRAAPLATLEIEATQPATVHLSLDVRDPNTGRQLEREIVLDSVPLDGHSLAVAVAADELLMSNWSRLASRAKSETTPPHGTAASDPAPKSVVPVASVVPGTVVPGTVVPGTVVPGTVVPGTVVPGTVVPGTVVPASGGDLLLLHELALLVAAERFGGGSYVPGVDLAIRRWILPHWALQATAGGRAMVEESAPHGRVHSRSWPFSLGVWVSFFPRTARARAGAAATLATTALFFSAEPSAGAVSRRDSAIAVYLRGDVWADVALLRRLRLRASAGAGVPLRGVSLDDSGVPVAGARGVELHGSTGMVLEF